MNRTAVVILSILLSFSALIGQVSVRSGKLLVKIKGGHDVNALGLHNPHRLYHTKTGNHPLDRWYLVDANTLGPEREALLNDPSIEAVTADQIDSTFGNVPNDFYYTSQWALPKILLPQAWDSTQGDTTNTLIGLVDTGVDTTHPDLVPNLWVNPTETRNNGIDDDGNGYVDDIHGWNFVEGNNRVWDNNGHGTGCFGEMAAVGNNSIGIAGVMWHGKVVVCRGLDSTGVGYFSNLANAIIYCVDRGCTVVSNSWGGGGSTRDPLWNDVQAYAASHNTLLVFAAGNNNSEAMDFAPGDIDGNMCIAASDSLDQRAVFSNFSEKVDVAAPGVNILLTAPVSPNNFICVTSGRCGPYDHLSGTSMATPMVAGLAALVHSKYPTRTAEELKQIIRVSADDLGTPGKDIYYGYGRINAYNALRIAQQGVLTPAFSNLRSGDTLAGTVTLVGSVRGSSTFVSWRMDYGSSGAWVTFANGTTTNISASINTGTMPQGMTNIRLVVVDNFGREYVIQRYLILVRNIELALTVPPAVTYRGAVPITGFVHILTSGTGVNKYYLEYGRTTNPSSFTPFDSGSVPVDGTLGTWHTDTLTNFFTYTLRLRTNTGTITTQFIRIDSQLVAGYPLKLSVIGNSGIDSWFPVSFQPIITDLNGTGADDIVSVAKGSIWVNQTLIRKDSLIRGVNVADLDRDGKKEIIFSFRDDYLDFRAHLHVMRSDGTTYPGWVDRDIIPGNMAIADVDSNGLPEIIYVDGNTHKLCALSVNAIMAPGFPTGTNVANGNTGQVSAGNGAILMGGTQLPYVSGYLRDTVTCWNYNGTQRWKIAVPNLPSGHVPWVSTPSLIDASGDSIPEAWTVANDDGGGQDAILYQLSLADGSILNQYTIPNFAGSVNVAEPTGAGRAVFIPHKDSIRVIDTSGVTDLKAPQPSKINGGNIWAPSSVDIVDRSQRTLIWYRTGGVIAGISLTGDSLFEKVLAITNSLDDPFWFQIYPVSVGKTKYGFISQAHATIGFANGVPSTNNFPFYYLYLWSLPDTATQSWGQYRHDAGLTANLSAPAPPPLPSPLKAALLSPANGTINSPTSVVLSWNDDTYALTYELDYGTDSTFAVTTAVPGLLSTSYPISALANSTTYYWRVRGVNSTAPGTWSDTWAFTTIAVPVNPPPTVTITYPADGQTVRKNTQVTILATTTDDVAVTQTQFFAAGKLLCSYPYGGALKCVWIVPKQGNRTYSIVVSASDGTQTKSATISVKAR